MEVELSLLLKERREPELDRLSTQLFGKHSLEGSKIFCANGEAASTRCMGGT